MRVTNELESSVSLSVRAQAIILGALLGDGSLKIHKPYKNARFSFRHSIKQQEYFRWKAEELREVSSEKNIFVQRGDGFSKVDKLRYQSRACESLTKLHKLTYRKNNLAISRKWLNKMTPLSLAIWWLDDGSLISNSRKGVFCTDEFSYESQVILTRYMSKVWGIKLRIGKIGPKRIGIRNEYYRLWLRSTEELKKFLRIISPCIPVKEMLPKVILLYKDPKLQQRWISEVSKLSGFSIETVENAVRDKKSKWKAFRE
jgi:hypothetical protein